MGRPDGGEDVLVVAPDKPSVGNKVWEEIQSPLNLVFYIIKQKNSQIVKITRSESRRILLNLL